MSFHFEGSTAFNKIIQNEMHIIGTTTIFIFYSSINISVIPYVLCVMHKYRKLRKYNLSNVSMLQSTSRVLCKDNDQSINLFWETYYNWSSLSQPIEMHIYYWSTCPNNSKWLCGNCINMLYKSYILIHLFHLGLCFR